VIPSPSGVGRGSLARGHPTQSGSSCPVPWDFESQDRPLLLHSLISPLCTSVSTVVVLIRHLSSVFPLPRRAHGMAPQATFDSLSQEACAIVSGSMIYGANGPRGRAK